MNEVLEKIKSRRSIRKYKAEPVPQELLDQIIETGLCAPSARGCQDTIIVQLTEPTLRNELADKNRQIAGMPEGSDPFYGAPAVLIVLAKKDSAFGTYDGSLVMENLMLAAHALELGSCWIHRAYEEFESDWGKAFLHSLGIDEEYVGIGHCIVGYIDCEYPNPPEINDGRVYYAK